jgi:hypothetical protein
LIPVNPLACPGPVGAPSLDEVVPYRDMPRAISSQLLAQRRQASAHRAIPASSPIASHASAQAAHTAAQAAQT